MTLKNNIRSVSFAACVDVFEIPHINDLEEQDIQAIWWSKEDFRCFKAEIRKTLNSMIEFGWLFQETEDSCSRGLENCISQRLSIRNSRRASAARAILFEQRLQWDEGSHDPEYIADVYTEISKNCQNDAHARALQDHEQVIPRRWNTKQRQPLQTRLGEFRVSLAFPPPSAIVV
jgi:hypothetical protein